MTAVEVAAGDSRTPAVERALRFDPAELASTLGLPSPTDEQAAVIAAPLAPALVVAGAGSGKTETMAARVVYLVANGLVRPDQVLGLTFTRKAATSLAVRIRTRLRALEAAGLRLAGPSGFAPNALDAAAELTAEPTVGTYHSFAGRLIAEFGALGGIGPATRVLGPTAAWQLARRVVGHWDADLATDRTAERVTEDVLAIAGALSDHLASSADLDAELAGVLQRLRSAPPSPRQRAALHSGLVDALRRLDERRAILPLVRAYTEAKRASGVVDFSDQMQLAARVVLESDQVGTVLRERFPVVLLDEYQDTGHAQRVILRALFGSPHGRGHAVTAVGDPVQSIYGWRGASASNLPRFGADFPARDGRPAARLSLLTSFRNAKRILDLANVVSEPVRVAPVPVDRLRPRPDASTGTVRSALFERVDDEDAWVAGHLAEEWSATAPPSAAVLLRRRADMAGMADALRRAGLPVEVVGVGGLIDEPEVADLIAMLRVVVDHDAGPAVVRLLLGPRWRLGLADLTGLAARARRLSRSGTRPSPSDRDEPAPAGGEPVRTAQRALDDAVRAAVESADGLIGLVDAVLDPGPESDYSAQGWPRILAFGAEIRQLRTRMMGSLSELVADVERISRLDIEALLRHDGRVHLDAFAELVEELALDGAGPIELLDYLAAAVEREDGLTPGAVEPVPGRVQVLTVHAAKGLEWDIVAIPHLCADLFPATRTTTWLGEAGRLPPGVRGDRDDLPELVLPAEGDQSEMVKALHAHVAELKSAQLDEERRLMYVGLTRARETLLLSAHHWGRTGQRPRGPSEFFTELRAAPDAGAPEVDAPPPSGAVNPIVADPVTAHWPVDPLGGRRADVEAAAMAVREGLASADRRALAPPTGPDDPPPGEDNGWLNDVETLLAEHFSARDRISADVLPGALSVSGLVDLTADPQGLIRRLRRPLPTAPARRARRGTAFHAWVERRYSGDALLDLDDLPGSDDRDAIPDEALPELIAAFDASAWAARVPIAVEVPFSTVLGGLVVRGRIDAVFADGDGGVTIVDWKTGSRPAGQEAEAAAVQLHAYRVAWSRLTGLDLAAVRAVFHFVATGETVAVSELSSAAELDRRIRDAVAGIVATAG